MSLSVLKYMCGMEKLIILQGLDYVQEYSSHKQDCYALYVKNNDGMKE